MTEFIQSFGVVAPIVYVLMFAILPVFFFPVPILAVAGGLAFGFDRWLMVMLNEASIKEVIPFPKTNKGQDLMTGAPANVEEKQLHEDLMLKIIDNNM